MAIITKGITGGIKGQIGQVIGYNYNGLNIIRGKKLVNKTISNQVISENGSNLLVCVELWNRIYEALNLIVTTHNHNATIDYNSFIKTALADAVFGTPKYVNSMSFGTDQFNSKLAYSADNIVQYNSVNLGIQNVYSAFAMDNTIVQKLGFYRSRSNFKSLSTQAVNNNNTQSGIDFQFANSGDFLLIFYWLQSVATGKQSKIGFSARIKE